MRVNFARLYRNMSVLSRLLESESDSDSDASFSKYDSKRALILQDIELQNSSNSRPPSATLHVNDQPIPISLKSVFKGENLLLVLNFMLLFLMPIFMFDLTTMTSCREGSLMCFPQMKLEVVDTTPKARSTLLSLRLGLKMVSFVASDFGESDLVSSDSSIDTFSPHNVFSLNNRGFCRLNTETGDDYCIDGNGLDIFSSIIMDVGIQLGNINPSQDSKDMGKSLDKSITLIVDLFEELYDQAVENKEQSEFKMKQLTTAHSINSLKNYGKLQALAPFYSLTLCVFMLVALTTTRFFGKDKYMNWTTGIIASLVFLHFSVIFYRFMSELISHYRISKSAREFEIVNLSFSWGYLFLSMILIFDIISLAGLTNAFMKKRNNNLQIPI